MGSTRDMIISFVEGSCEDRNATSTKAGLVDKVWLISRPPEGLNARLPLVSAFRLNLERQKGYSVEEEIKPKVKWDDFCADLPPDKEGGWCNWYKVDGPCEKYDKQLGKGSEKASSEKNSRSLKKKNKPT